MQEIGCMFSGRQLCILGLHVLSHTGDYVMLLLGHQFEADWKLQRSKHTKGNQKLGSHLRMTP
jgi:hypothetical protein